MCVFWCVYLSVCFVFKRGMMGVLVIFVLCLKTMVYSRVSWMAYGVGECVFGGGIFFVSI